MQCQDNEITIETINDFEFGIQKERKCTYRIYGSNFDNGLAVYIPGFGGDLGSYTDVFCRKISTKYQIATISVEYFCIHSRPNVGAEIEFEEIDLSYIKKIFGPTKEINFPILKNIAKNFNQQVHIKASLKPKNGEYQNFGILPAIDIINCIFDAIKRFSINRNNIILTGSSYGGYIANIITKIVPGYIRAVFDNLSWANPNLSYVVGREINSPEFSIKISEQLILYLFVKSPWTLIKGLPNSFIGDKYAIRCFSEDQISQMADQGGVDTFYIFSHYYLDNIAPTSEKINMVNSMIRNEFKYIHMEIFEKNDIDGKFIKQAGHGMGLSMIDFFDKSYKHINAENNIFKSNNRTHFEYNLYTSSYLFHINNNKIECEIKYM